MESRSRQPRGFDPFVGSPTGERSYEPGAAVKLHRVSLFNEDIQSPREGGPKWSQRLAPLRLALLIFTKILVRENYPSGRFNSVYPLLNKKDRAALWHNPKQRILADLTVEWSLESQEVHVIYRYDEAELSRDIL